MPADRLRVLVTRAEPDAAPLAARLRDDGYEPTVEPLLAIVPTGAAVDLAGIQALLLTSANGVRALAAQTARRDLPLFAVGDATAQAAAAAGFASVASAGGDVNDLARLATARCDPRAGALLHVAGRDVAGDLGGALESAGFAVRRAVLYRAETRESLSDGLRAAIAAGRIDAALFLSPRTARSFVTLAGKAGLAASLARIAAICLSQAVAAALGGTGWRAIRIAGQPTQAGLLAALAGWAAERRGSE